MKKKDFDDCLNLIKSEKIRKFVEKALEMAPKEFWIAPCSSSGKYHPPEDQVKGGTIIHSRKAIQVALSLFNFFDITDQLTKDQIIAACILHDIQKNGIPWSDKTNYEHGPIAAKWLVSEVMENKFDGDLLEIADLVENHMGKWNQPQPTPALHINPKTHHQLIGRKTIKHLIVQLADYWASRKWCSFVCNKFFEE
jgi:hypothetical protein